MKWKILYFWQDRWEAFGDDNVRDFWSLDFVPTTARLFLGYGTSYLLSHFSLYFLALFLSLLAPLLDSSTLEHLYVF